MPASFGTGRPPAWAEEDGQPPTVEPAGERGGARSRRLRQGSAGRRGPDGEAPERSDAEWEELARSVALRLLTAAPRSRAQLEEALDRKDVPAGIATAVLDRFTEVGLVDDAAYADMLVRTRHFERGLARRALTEELRRKGIDGEVAEAALDQVGAEDEEAAARRLVAKKARATRGLESHVRRRRMAATLARKGFGSELSLRVIDEVLAEEAEDDDLPGR